MEVIKEIHSKSILNGDALNNGNGVDNGSEIDNIAMETTRMKFLMLGLDLPPPPLFKDVMEKNIIPQVSVFSFFFFSVCVCNLSLLCWNSSSSARDL